MKALSKGMELVAIILLIAFAGYGLIAVAKFIGYASFAGSAGEIYDLNIEFTEDQNYYGGMAGVAVRVDSFSGTQSVNLQGNVIEKENLLFDCLNPDGEQEVYASFEPLNQLDTSTLDSATPAEVDNYLGINSSSLLSATKTYTETFSITFGTQTITAPGLRTYTSDLDPSNFTTLLLKDANDNLIFGSILTNFTSCFDTDTCNFQYLLPVQNGTNETYYFWRDPADTCPAGESGGRLFGNVIGNVTDNNGNVLEDVIVDVAGFTTLSDSNGFYNLTTVDGDYNIYAIKEGYQTYKSNITVLPDNTTVHNIIMVQEVSPNPLTGVGPGQDAPGTETQTGVGPGQDVGPGQTDFQPIIEEPKKIEGKDYIISTREIKRKLRIDSFIQEIIKFFSFKDNTAQVNIEINGTVNDLISIDKNELFVEPDDTNEATLTFFGRGKPGIYNGSMIVTGDMNATIPIEIELLPKEKVPVEALLMDIETSEKSYIAGNRVKFKTDLRNMLTDRPYPVALSFTVQNEDGTETLWTDNTNVFLKTSFSVIKNFNLPTDLDSGDYILRVTANYLDLSSGTSTIFKVNTPWLQRTSFWKIKNWMILAFIFLVGAGVGAFFYIKKKIEENKRYHLKVNYDEMPKPGPRSIFVGKIAETDHKCYFNMEKFKTHTIVAGSTGGGKSVTAQVIIEEMLQRDVGIVVFDPTAQWSGMLRKCKDESMIALYSYFGMKKSDAQAFNGNIREITDAREVVDVMKYVNPGEINVFACHKLDPKDLDLIVANAIRELFHSNLDESKPLRAMVVFDEVHRLLPKFGGSGDGFLQVERACREFRKWGIGVMLISQVLSDFMGTIKANINTEVQMRTRDEGDLERIRQKYGENVLRSLTMATVGTGMVENPAYNDGRPFFVAFRPLLHSVERLSDEEISQYNEFNEKIDQLQYSLEQLEEKDVDVFDLKLELKLARDKVKTGNFNVVNVYLDGLKPRIEKEWNKLGEQPKKLEKKLVSLEEIKKETEKAKKEREQYEEENKEEEVEDKEEGPPPWDKEVNPDKILNLKNGMVVLSQQSLYDEVSAMKDEVFEKHVDDAHNDFADWIRNAIGDPELADHMLLADSKEDLLALLEKRKNEEDLPELTDEQKSDLNQKKAFDEMSKDPEESSSEEESSGEAESDGEASPADGGSSEKKEESKSESGEQSPQNPQTEPSQPQPAEASAEPTSPDKEPAKAETESPEQPQPAEAQGQPETQQPQQAAKEEQQPESQPQEESSSQQEPQQETQPSQGDGSKNLEQLVADSPDKYFKLENGKEIKSVPELKNYLTDMPDEMFHKHVGEDYNHFADWIEGVFQASDVANQIRNIKDKNQMAEAL